ncbi:hypothetical protein BS17DRAFT_437171 [Gyrodon lividus]|nr:hypothetical protein BS17DRAFT_437171 [Gyrodon lividus]
MELFALQALLSICTCSGAFLPPTYRVEPRPLATSTWNGVMMMARVSLMRNTMDMIWISMALQTKGSKRPQKILTIHRLLLSPFKSQTREQHLHMTPVTPAFSLQPQRLMPSILASYLTLHHLALYLILHLALYLILHHLVLHVVLHHPMLILIFHHPVLLLVLPIVSHRIISHQMTSTLPSL